MDLLPIFLAIVILFDKIIFPLWRNWRAERKLTFKTQKIVVPNNPNSKPGNSTVCKENRDKIIGFEKSIENIEEDIKEIKDNNRKDHEKIFDKIDKIKEKRR